MNEQQNEQQQIEHRLSLEKRAKAHPPGTIGVPCRVQAAYSVFTHSVGNVVKPPGSKLSMVAGPSIHNNHNQFIREMWGDWMFLMGDDHEFQEDILVRLLERDVDVVVPLVMRRLPPFQLVLYKGEQEQEGSAPPEYEYIWHWELPHSGLMEVYAAGTAGMLVRRHVLDAVGPPWFSTTHGIQNEDLEFCRKVREAGFKIWADTELYLGHIVTGSIHSARRDGKWGYVIEFGPGDEIFVVPTRPSAVVMPEDAESRIVVPPGVR